MSTLDTNPLEKTATEHIPYTLQYDHFTCGTVDTDLTRTIQLQGVPFETLSNAQINGFSRQWTGAINTLAGKGGRVALWTHVVRRRIAYDMSQIEYDNWFSNEFGKQYAKHLGSRDFFTNEMFLSPVLRQPMAAAEKIAGRLSKDAEQKTLVIEAGLNEIDKITRQLMVSLRPFHPTLLGTETQEDGTVTSELARFYSRLLNGGESGPVALNTSSVRYAIQRNDLHFGREIIEIQMPHKSRYIGILGIKAPYGTEEVRSDLLHGLLKLPCEFILSQSMTFMPGNKAEKFLKDQIAQMTGAEQNALIRQELVNAKEQLQSGKFGLGEHEFILAVYGDTIADVNLGIGEATAALEAKSLAVTRERRGTLITQHFSTLPANFLMKRVRAMPITTQNFASFFPIQNFMSGNASGSQWGMPLMLMQTTSDAPYFYNHHVSRQSLDEQGFKLEYVETEEDAAFDEAYADYSGASEINEDGTLKPQRRQRKESGNTRIDGINGSGKTVFMGAVRTLTRKKNTRGKRPFKSFVFDKDYGQEILICALGGRYFRFALNEPTGLAPFSLTDTPGNRGFIVKLLLWCAQQEDGYSRDIEDEARLQAAVASTFKLTRGRKLARVRDELPKGKNTLQSALARWTENGEYAWVFDNDVDLLDLENANDFGFDMTQFLGDKLARTAILSYIMHKISLVAPGSPHTVEIDEAAAAIKDDFMVSIIDNFARVIRKQDGVIMLGFQNSSDGTEGALAGTIASQFPTACYFPNPSADIKELMDKRKLTEKEAELVQRGMSDRPGLMLIKKGNESTVVQMDMTGMGDMLSVFSGSPDNVEIARQMIARFGPEPKNWVPEFFKRRT